MKFNLTSSALLFIGISFSACIGVNPVADKKDSNPPGENKVKTVQTQRTVLVEVTSAKELKEAIASNTSILLSPGKYLFDDGLVLDDIQNLSIHGKSDRGKTEILVRAENEDVILIQNSGNVSLKNLTFGHETESHCMGGVIGVKHSERIKVENCSLFGSGIEGFRLLGVNGFEFLNCEIRECTQQILTMIDSKNIDVRDSQFHSNGVMLYHNIVSLFAQALFTNVEVRQNISRQSYLQVDNIKMDYRKELADKQDLSPSKLVFSNCLFEGTYFAHFDENNVIYTPKKEDLISSKPDQVELVNCRLNLTQLEVKNEH